MQIILSQINEKLNVIELLEDIMVKNKLPVYKIGWKKWMDGEQIKDSWIVHMIWMKFIKEVFRAIQDWLKMNLIEWFSNNQKLIANMQYLDPKNFNEINANSIHEKALIEISRLSNV